MQNILTTKEVSQKLHMGITESDNYITIKDVSDQLHIGYNKARKLFHLKGFPSIKIGGTYLVKYYDFQEYLDRHKGCEINL